jgi:hypothetical protein
MGYSHWYNDLELQRACESSEMRPCRWRVTEVSDELSAFMLRVTAKSYERVAPICQAQQCRIPEDSNRHPDRYRNLKFRTAGRTPLHCSK